MSKLSGKHATPPYVSYKSLTSFLNGLRELDHIPDRIDRSSMSKFSGAVQNATFSALKFLNMADEKSAPTALFIEYVQADDESRKPILAKILRDSYSFVFNTPGFNIERATGHQVSELFRPQGVNGSTLSRAIAFFLAAAKEANIKISPHVKAPSIQKNGAPKSKRAKSVTDTGQGIDNGAPPPEGTEILEIPIPINRKVKIELPSDFKASDWALFKTILDAYIGAWTAEKTANEQKDKRPTPEE